MKQQPPSVQLMQMLFGFASARAIGACAELNIADLLKERTSTAEALAQQANVHAPSLYRVLRLCASLGVFAEDEQHRFSLTPLAEPLCSNVPGSLKDFAIMITSGWVYQMWIELPYSIKTGKPAFEKVFGMHVFEYFRRNEKAATEFNASMTSLTAFENDAVLNGYDFSAVSTLVDVGGGQGFMLASILARYKHMQGVLFDTPAVAADAQKLLENLNVANRCKTIGGDFFSSVPAGADTYILKHVIHDWNDEECVSILKNCRKAMKDDGKILIVEEIVAEGNEPALVKFVDVQMLVVASGCERSEKEYIKLLDDAGLTLNRIVPTASPHSVLECVNK